MSEDIKREGGVVNIPITPRPRPETTEVIRVHRPIPRPEEQIPPGRIIRPTKTGRVR